MENLRKEFTKETGISVKAIRQDYPGQKPYEDGFCDDYVLWLESRITEKRKEANEFIKSIAEMVGIDIDVVGFDGVTLSIDDFEEAIEKLKTNKRHLLIDFLSNKPMKNHHRLNKTGIEEYVDIFLKSIYSR